MGCFTESARQCDEQSNGMHLPTPEDGGVPIAEGRSFGRLGARLRLGVGAALGGTAGDWRPWEAVGVAVALELIFVLNGRIDLIWTPSPWWAVAGSLIAAVLLARRVPIWVSALWLLGLLSYLWSLTPGATLLAALWGLTWLAAAGAGRARAGLALVVFAIASNELLNALALNAFHLESYVSGSVHYRLGAKALVLLPIFLVGLWRAERRALSGLAWLLATVSAFSVLISGSRGVYLAMAVVLVGVTVKASRRASHLRRLLLGLVGAAAVIVAVNAVLPFHPVSAAIDTKASVEAQASAVDAGGSFTQRLRFWDQGLGMVLSHPLGVGLGGFRGTIHAFQKFPMVWSSSPHNIFVETAATLGWPGLVLLVGMLGVAFVRAWRGPRWPWGLALLATWLVLAVDVTADYPSIMVLAFALVGACLGPGSPGNRPLAARHRTMARARTWAAGLAVVAGASLAVYWYAPCHGTSCVVSRWRGVEYLAVPAAGEVPASDRAAYFQRLEHLYPKSLWVLQLEQKYAATLQEKLALAGRIARDYPLQSWRNYLTWADLSLQAGDVAQAKEAVRTGLDVFGPDSHRYPERRADPAGFQNWLQRANEILALP